MKVSDRNSDRRKQKKSFDIFAEDEVKILSSEIQKMYESLRLIEMLEEIRRNGFQTNNWFNYNFIIKDRTLEDPVGRKFDLYPSKITQKTAKKSKENKSLYDIIKDDHKVTITIDMPDTKKGEISLRITRDTVEIMPNNLEGKYHRVINLPCNVKPKTAIFTYNNGILDIVLTRKKE